MVIDVDVSNGLLNRQVHSVILALRQNPNGNDMSFGADRRRYVRVPGPFDGRVAAKIEMAVQIADLSEGGCFVVSLDDPPKPGTFLTLKIDLPEEGWITAETEVRYAWSGHGYAVQFMLLTADDFIRLQRTLSRIRLTAGV